MLKIKLSRRGKKKQPTYRLVVLDKKKDPWGKSVEDVGSYNPHDKKAQLKIERIKFWISKGAQPTETVHNLLVKEKVLDALKKKIKIKASKKKPAAPTEIPAKPEETVKSEMPVTEPETNKEKIKTEESKPIEEKKEEPAKEPVKEEKSTEKNPEESVK